MTLRVREPGLYSLLVDRGRPRSRSLGVPVGGPADCAAMALGNALVGNEPDALALEVSFAGPILEALDATACVLFGAPFQSHVNGVPVAAGTTFTLEPGDVLTVGGTPTHARAYLCVAGGFTAPTILESCSALGPVRAGDELMCKPTRIQPRGLPFSTAEGEHVADSPVVVLQVLPGPQRDWFTDDSFFAQVYEVAAASNRMGVRLKGPPLARRAGELVSEAVAPGAVQVANDGQPVVLGVDAQTIGGYPKIAHVIRADLDRLGQLRPGELMRFVAISMEEAETATRARAAYVTEWLTRLRAADRPPRFVE